MHYRPLGRTGWQVSEIGLGTYPLGGALHTSGSYWSGPATYGGVAREDALAAIYAGLARGLNFIDTAPVYGEAESFIGEALTRLRIADCGLRIAAEQPPTRRHRSTTADAPSPAASPQPASPNPQSAIGNPQFPVVATKCGEHVRPQPGGGPPVLARDFSRAALRESLERSRSRLGVERLDLVLLHSPAAEEMAEDPLGLLVELRDRGEIAHVGVSARSVRHAVDLIEEDGRAEVLQVPFSLMQPEAAGRLLPLAAEQGVGIVIRTPLASGFLTGEIAEEHVFASDDHRSQMPREQIARMARQARAFGWLVEEGIAATLSEAALRYILSFPEVSTVIPGAMTAIEVERNLAISDLGPLPAAALARVRHAQEALGVWR